MNVSAAVLMKKDCKLAQEKAKDDFLVKQLEQVKMILKDLEGENQATCLEMIEGCIEILEG